MGSTANLRADSRHDRLIDMLTSALGPKVGDLMNDPTIVEIMLNPDGHLWIDRLGQGRSDTGHKIKNPDARRAIELVATSTDTICNMEHPIVSAELPGSGNRFQGILPPVSTAPVFTVRKKALMIFSLDHYSQSGIVTEKQKDCIIQAVKAKDNILIIGGTGSGKTTLANAVLNEIAKTGDRNIIIEDTLELQCPAPDSVFLRSRDHVSMNDLLKATMRLRPDRIIVGEVRGPEALTLLKSWNTGHPGGLATIHANSAYGGLTRLEQLIQEAIPNPQRELIAEAVDLLIYIERYQHSRRVKEIATVQGWNDNRYHLENF